MDVASLIVKVSTTGVQTTQAQLDKLSATASNAQKSAGSLNLGMLGLTATLGLLTKEAIKMGDEWTNINSKLNLVTKTTQEFYKAQTELFNISQNTRTSISSSVELYRKLAVSTESLNISQNRLLKVTETINKAGIIGGGSKESINAALIQLGQGLASGALRGEELNSVLEQTPRLAKLIADGMGVQVGALKSLAEAGKITSETIIKAAEAGEKGIAKEFDVVQATISSAMDVIEGSITKTVGTLDSATGATRSLSMAMIELSKDINQNNTDIVATGQFIYATISRTIDVFNVLYESVENTGQIVIGHINLLAYGSLEVILTMLTKVTEGLNVLGIASDKGLKEAYSDLAYVQGLVANANNLIADSYDDLNKAVIKLSPTIEDRIKGYNAENKAITEKLELQKKELAQNQTKGKSKLEVEAELKLEKEKQEAEKKAQREAIKLSEEWSKRNIEITTNMAIAQQDELAKPFIVLEAKYKKDLEEFKGVKGAKERLTLEYNAEVERQLKDLTEKFNKEEEAKAKKSAEWQVKILEANEKYNEEIIKMQDEMYGTDTTVEAWYNNQLEYLGKLSQEAGATAEELQTLLDKIETLKSMKLQKQTISFKLEQSFYNSFENNLADSIEDAFNGTLNFKKFFKNIGNDLMKTFSSSLASVGTNMLRGNYSALAALGGGAASLVGTSISAGDISGIMNSGGTFDSATNTITTSGGTKIELNESGGGSVSSTGSDIMSLVSTVSTLKTAYTVATQGLTGMFNGLTGAIDSGLGFVGLGGSVGAGGLFVNPLTGTATSSAMGAGAFVNPATLTTQSTMASGTAAAQGASYGTIAGGALVGGAVGYGAGYLGDKLFGANTYASTTGAIGGAAAGGLYASGMISGPVGWAVLGASLLLGGLFGKKKVTDVGYQFFDNMSALDEITTDTVKQYSDWKKKSWFSSSKGTNYSNLSSKEMKQIESVFDTYDYLLGQLGDTDKIWLNAGKYTGASFGDALSKNFISAFTDVNQNNDATFYQAWVDYATSIDATVMEAFTSSIGGFIQSKRTFEVWALGDSIEALAKKAEFATADLNQIKDTLGATGTTVESFLSDFDKAVKENFTPETITQWESLGSALMTATDATTLYSNALKAQEDALKNANELIRQSTLSVLSQQLASLVGVFGAIQNAMNNLNPTFMTFSELANETINLDNYSILLSELEKTRQSEIEKLVDTSELRIAQLEKEKDYFVQIMDYVNELTKRMNVQTTTLGTFFYVELQKAKDNFAKGSEVNISDLNTSASSYLDSVQKNSSTQRDYFLEVAKVRNELSEFGTDLAEGGSLEGIENAILTEQNTLNFQLELLNKTATSLLESWKNTTIGNINTTTGNINTVKNDDITKAYSDILGRTADTAGYEYWNNQILSGSVKGSDITQAIASASIDEIYKNVLSREPDEAGKAYWMGQIANGSIKPSDIDEAIKNAAGFANGGYTGNIGVNDIAGVVHGQEYVVNAQTTKDLGLNGGGGAFADMVAELASLRKLMVKLVSDNTKQLSTQRAILGERVAI